MEMNVNVVIIGLVVVINPHPKDLSKSPLVAAGFFVYGIVGRLGYA